jgi:gas vesicle protein
MEVGPKAGQEWRCKMSERDETIERHGDSFGWFFFSFLLGVLVGAVLALVSAPKSGEESREWLRARGIELRTRTADLTGKGRERLDEWSERGREQIGKIRGKVEQRVEAPGQPEEEQPTETVEAA